MPRLDATSQLHSLLRRRSNERAYGPLAVSAALAVFIGVFVGWTFVLLRVSFASRGRSQWIAGAVLAIAWILMVRYGADLVQQLYVPVHNDYCDVNDPRDPHCGSPGWGMGP